ncbi:MAG: class I SAM-dependent RNA methyltransferase, partial [Rothia sp. (in: high G+C Gram-positive bacteria)]|nr:class I SAM-dependent RNA methyltransferase [Rothia sp. (in: high G+C Gram-positive bacteria)]
MNHHKRDHIQPDIEIGQLIEVTPERPAHGGSFVARVGGRVFFVRHAVTGETATAQVTGKGPKGRFFFADVIGVKAPSADRRPHPWQPADALAHRHPLGGMEYGHLTPESQRRYKKQIVVEQLTRLGGMPESHPMLTDLPVHTLPDAPGACAEGMNWRTRSHFAIDRETGRIAMYPQSSHQPVPVESFPLMDARLEALNLGQLRFEGVKRLDVAVTATDMIALIFTVPAALTPAEVAPAIEATCREAWGSLEEHLITLVFTAEKQGGRRRGAKPADVVVGAGNADLLETATVFAQDYYWEVAASGFWQIHRSAPEVLGNAVLEMARLRKGQAVYDLYAGAGFFTAIVADAVGARGTVLSVEGSPVTSGNAATNFATDGAARTHRSERTTVRVERGDVGQVLSSLVPEIASGQFPAPDVVILDPSREGAGKAVIEQIAELAPSTVIYV